MSDERTLDQILSDLEAQVDEFAGILAAPQDVLWRKPSDDDWSAAMCVVHISDAEVHVAGRLRRMLTEDNPAFPNWDEELHMALTHERSPEIAFAVIASLRASNADLLRHVGAEQLARTGIRPDGEVLNVPQFLEAHISHTDAHLEQARAALGQ
jgi:hypothetical protein